MIETDALDDGCRQGPLFSLARFGRNERFPLSLGQPEVIDVCLAVVVKMTRVARGRVLDPREILQERGVPQLSVGLARQVAAVDLEDQTTRRRLDRGVFRIAGTLVTDLDRTGPALTLRQRKPGFPGPVNGGHLVVGPQDLPTGGDVGDTVAAPRQAHPGVAGEFALRIVEDVQDIGVHGNGDELLTQRSHYLLGPVDRRTAVASGVSGM